MQDLIVLELIIAAVLFLAMSRPFVKSISGVDGIAALPTIALIASVAVYPAYGFRPEVIPLTALSFIMFLGSIPRLVDIFRRLRTDDYGERGFGRLAIGVISLAAVTAFAIAYAPKTERFGDLKSAAFQETVVRDDMRGVELYLRYYPGSGDSREGLRRPIILIAPPTSGSVVVTDSLSAALADRGFFVMVFSRNGMDFPAFKPGGRRIYPGFDTFIRSAVSFAGGMRFVFAARYGEAIEHERNADFEFLVKYARIAAERRDQPYWDADPERIILVGFGAGGAAATLYASSSTASSITAAVAVEGPLLSGLRGEGQPDLPRSQKESGNLKAWFASLAERFRIERIVGTADVPSPKIPMLFLVSDHVREPKARDGRYATVLRALRTAEAPCLLASIDGASVFDYSEVGNEYPVYPAMMPGLNERSPEREYYIENTVTLITNFASKVIAQKDGTSHFIRYSLGDEIQIETGGSWTSTDVADILRP